MQTFNLRVGESVHIGDHVSVTLVRNEGNKVRLGTTADPSIPVDRAEIRARRNRGRAERGGASS